MANAAKMMAATASPLSKLEVPPETEPADVEVPAEALESAVPDVPVPDVPWPGAVSTRVGAGCSGSGAALVGT